MSGVCPCDIGHIIVNSETEFHLGFRKRECSDEINNRFGIKNRSWLTSCKETIYCFRTRLILVKKHVLDLCGKVGHLDIVSTLHLRIASVCSTGQHVIWKRTFPINIKCVFFRELNVHYVCLKDIQ
jgi:hypothetical protein